MKNNKFKLIAFLLAIICIATISYGCGKNDSNTEITDFTPVTTITANAIESFGFDFEEISIDKGCMIAVYRETTTDTIWVKGYGSNGIGISQFDDPETGKPLTYTIWLEKYANK